MELCTYSRVVVELLLHWMREPGLWSHGLIFWGLSRVTEGYNSKDHSVIKILTIERSEIYQKKHLKVSRKIETVKN